MKPNNPKFHELSRNDTNPVWSAQKVKVPPGGTRGRGLRWGEVGKPRDGGVALSVSVCKRVNIFQYWWNLSVCFTRDTGRLSLKCRTHKEQQREHKHTFTSKRNHTECWTERQSGRRPQAWTDNMRIGTRCACVCLCVRCFGVFEWGVCVFLGTFNG